MNERDKWEMVCGCACVREREESERNFPIQNDITHVCSTYSNIHNFNFTPNILWYRSPLYHAGITHWKRRRKKEVFNMRIFRIKYIHSSFFSLSIFGSFYKVTCGFVHFILYKIHYFAQKVLSLYVNLNSGFSNSREVIHA